MSWPPPDEAWLEGAGPGLQERGLGLVVVALSDADCGIGLVDLLDGDVLFLQQRLDSMVVVGIELELRFCRGRGGLGAGNGSASRFDIASCCLDAGL